MFLERLVVPYIVNHPNNGDTLALKHNIQPATHTWAFDAF